MLATIYPVFFFNNKYTPERPVKVFYRVKIKIGDLRFEILFNVYPAYK